MPKKNKKTKKKVDYGDREPDYIPIGVHKCPMCPRTQECVRIVSNENKGFVAQRSIILCQTCYARGLNKCSKEV